MRTATLLATLLFGFFACNPLAVPDVGTSQLVRLNLSSEPPTLNPSLMTDSTSGNLITLLFEGLTRMGPDLEIHLGIADKVDISEDRLTYRFHLREAFWSNGDPVRAQDFAYSWKLNLTPTHPSNYAYQFYVIKNAQAAKEGKGSLDEVGIRVLDDRTLEVDLLHPTPYFLELTASQNYAPIHQANAQKHPQWAENAGTAFISNGPFELKTWRHYNELVLVKGKRYWDADSVRLERIQFSMVEDSSTELNMFEDGALDWAGKPVSTGLPSDSLPYLRDTGRLEVSSTAATYFLQLNTKTPPLTHPKIRRALAYAVNRQAIVTHVTQGGETVALGLVPPSLRSEKKTWFSDHSPVEARRLFEEGLQDLGLNAGDLPPIALSYNTNETHHKIAQVIQQQWKEVLGLEVRLENFEWKVYLDQINKHNFDIGRLTWLADYRDPMTFLELFQFGKDSNNHTHWTHPEYQALLQEADAERDEQVRSRLLLQAEGLLMDEMPIIPLFHPTTTYLQNPRLKGVVLNGLGNIDFKWAYMEE